MRRAAVVGEPEIEEGAVVVRVVVEDPAREDSGGVFICRMKGFGDVTVERFPAGQTPWSDPEFRAMAATTAIEHALTQRDRFEPLFARLEAH